MRILFLDHTPFVGGAELALVRQIKYLDKKRFEPVVVCSGTVPKLVEKFEEAGAKVYTISFGQLKAVSPRVLWRFVLGVWGVWGVLREEKIDLVVTNTERAMYVGTLAAVLSRRRLVWWVRDFEYNRALFRALGRLPQKIICVSEAVRDYYGGMGNPKFEVVYVGSDFDEKLKEVSFNDVLRVKEELGLSGAFVVGYVGRLVKWKGADVLLSAALNSKFQIPNSKFVIVGSGRNQEGDIESELRQRVKEEGLEETVILTGQRDDVPVLMKVFDVFCHTSIKPEPFATVVVEAMMAGAPVVGTNIGGTPEIISPGRTGFLVPPNDPQKLAAVLSHLNSEQKLRQKVGEEGRRLVVAKNSETVVTGQIERIYETVKE